MAALTYMTALIYVAALLDYNRLVLVATLALHSRLDLDLVAAFSPLMTA